MELDFKVIFFRRRTGILIRISLLYSRVRILKEEYVEKSSIDE